MDMSILNVFANDNEIQAGDQIVGPVEFYNRHRRNNTNLGTNKSLKLSPINDENQ